MNYSDKSRVIMFYLGKSHNGYFFIFGKTRSTYLSITIGEVYNKNPNKNSVSYYIRNNMIYSSLPTIKKYKTLKNKNINSSYGKVILYATNLENLRKQIRQIYPEQLI